MASNDNSNVPMEEDDQDSSIEYLPSEDPGHLIQDLLAKEEDYDLLVAVGTYQLQKEDEEALINTIVNPVKQEGPTSRNEDVDTSDDENPTHPENKVWQSLVFY